MQFGKSLARVCRRYAVSVSACAIAGALIFTWTSVRVPQYQSVHSGYRPSDIWIVDRNGLPLESIRARNEKRSLEWTRWTEVSPAFQSLLIQAEDRRFYSHPGVDVLALAKASWDRVAGRTQRGASTLTMQLVGLINESPQNHRRSLWQKVTQIVSALKLGHQWSKDQILEAYINFVPFRGELVGLRAASLGYFGKNPSGLLKEEAAVLVALLRSPNSAAEVVAKRACLILKAKDCQPAEKIAAQILAKPYELNRARQLVPVLAKAFVEGETGSSVVRTSLDFRTQELALKILQEQLRHLKNQNVNDGAVLVLETQSGRVVAYVANGGAGSSSAEQMDGIQMRRQAGSTIKPFVYGTAFDWHYLSPSSLLEDSPADISVSQGRVYHPKNYDQIFRGFVGVGDALGSSMNVPAVRALQLVGEARVLERLRALGFTNLYDDEYYGPSLALGSIDVTLWELTRGFRQFSTEGSPFSRSTQLSIFNILASPEHRRFTFGMDSLLTLPFPAAVKTGTSKDMRDNWCIGWTPQYTVGVWVGNFNGEPMWNVSGMTGAAPIWRSLMLALHPHPPETLAKYVPPDAPLERRTISRIRYPAAGMLVGIDPDIPMPLQKLPIEIENPQRGQNLFLNNRLLNGARETTMWPLHRGKYLVELKAASGRPIDSVKFEVR